MCAVVGKGKAEESALLAQWKPHPVSLSTLSASLSFPATKMGLWPHRIVLNPH